MKIEDGTVVLIDYTLKSPAGEVLDSSEGDEPMSYLHGAGQIVSGLERALTGKAAGEALKIVVAAADGYGEKEATNAVRIPRDELGEDGPEPEVGMTLEAVAPDGSVTPLFIVGVEDEFVLVSTDHPLAGIDLHFDVTVREVRAATAEELEHGHAHGPGDHDHDHEHTH